MSDLELRRRRRIAAADPTEENLVQLGLAYLRFTSDASILKIAARRWYSKPQGRTFHRVSVYLNGEHLGESDITHGYGNAYLYTGWEFALANSDLPKPEEGEARWHWAERHGITIEDEVLDVYRKRDL